MRLDRDLPRIQAAIRTHRKPLALAGGVAAIAVFLSYATGAESTRILVRTDGVPDFKHASILGNPGEKVLQGEQTLFSRQQKEILEKQKHLQEEVTKLRGQLSQIQPGAGAPGTPPTLAGVPAANTQSAPPLPGAPSSPTLYGPPAPETMAATPPVGQSGAPAIRLGAPTDDYSKTPMRDATSISQAGPMRTGAGMGTSAFSGIDKSRRGGKPGVNVVSFPVKTSGAVYLKRPSVVLPTGSYVKAKLLTGVEAPEGKTYPALLQLDFAYVIPNHKRLDLTGCFAIAKAQGDLSTERVQMQAVKLSCVSKKGGFFEREVNGFVADDADNSFAVMGTVNTKQDRVAAMGFLSSVVTGISKAVQQAQTTQQATPLGGGQSMVTGDQAKYIGAGGAAEAASMVTQWYLKQAQNLLPTINVGSGQDVWIIMQDSVDLPKDYFAQNGEEGIGHAQNTTIYSYFTRIME
ncbi:TrbI/VirB10 family protein [Bdellovibrionota bacterium FG-1]